MHFDFVVKNVQHFLHFLHSGHKQIALLFQDFFSGFNGFVALLDQSHLLDQYFNGKPRAPHALDEINPPEIELVVIPNAAFTSIDWRNESDMFIITQRVR